MNTLSVDMITFAIENE